MWVWVVCLVEGLSLTPTVIEAACCGRRATLARRWHVLAILWPLFREWRAHGGGPAGGPRFSSGAGVSLVAEGGAAVRLRCVRQPTTWQDRRQASAWHDGPQCRSKETANSSSREAGPGDTACPRRATCILCQPVGLFVRSWRTVSSCTQIGRAHV